VPDGHIELRNGRLVMLLFAPATHLPTAQFTILNSGAAPVVKGSCSHALGVAFGAGWGSSAAGNPGPEMGPGGGPRLPNDEGRGKAIDLG
jgi:hypothetical protein